MRFTLTISLILTSLSLTGPLASTSAYAGDAGNGRHGADGSEASEKAKTLSRAEFYAAQDPDVDAAVDAIVQELSAVGTGPRETRISNPAPTPAIRLPLLANPGKLRGLGLVSQDAAEALADEAAAVRALPGGDEGEDDHAM